MRAVRMQETGGPEVLQVDKIDDPAPGPGEVLVETAAAGLNFIDTYQRKGLYSVPLPLTLGLEGAGTVQAVGDDVTAFTPGDRVAWQGIPASYAELVVVPAEAAVRVPEQLDLEVAAAVMLQGMTAHYLSHSVFPLDTDHTALVYAAAGGVGRQLVQLAKRRGARVLACTSTDKKAELARSAGADEIVRYRDVDIVETVRNLTEGRGVDVVYDSVGKDTWDASLRCLRPRGLMVLYGQASGPVPAFDPQLLNQLGSLYLTRPSLGAYVATRDELEWRAGDVFGWVAAGELDVRIGERHPLEDGATAYRRLEGRETAGKVLLLPSG